MLGFGDVWVFLAFILCILSMIICVIYGAVNWNEDIVHDEVDTEKWMKEEIEIEKSL